MAARSLAPHGGNDCVQTPDKLAELIVGHFHPVGRMLEPCAGNGAFLRALKKQGLKPQWREIRLGRDFLVHTPNHWDWIITNPPWSQFRAFLKQSMIVADNIVFLCLINACFMKARWRDKI